jgi:hypothetical protein
MQLSEDILHFVWRHGSFDIADLKTTCGQNIQLLNRGYHNHHSGPDFMEAKIKVEETLWAGHIEIHVKASDWYLHHHETDKAYDNVILHVVYFNDKDIFINGQKLLTLELNGRIPPSLFSKYKNLLQKKNEIACAHLLFNVNETTRVSQMERSLIDRLERKADKILTILKTMENDWEETIFRILCFQMIGKINEQPMEWLLNEIKLKQLRISGKNSFQKEAILFGIAGMLKEASDEYSQKLAVEYKHLKMKYNYAEIEPHLWRYGRIRPAQFPSIRMSQIIAIISKNEFIFDSILKSDISSILNEFLNVEANLYWQTHHQFGKTMEKRSVKIGKMQKDLIIINLIAPFLFAYGKYYSEEKWKEKAANLLMKIKPEENNILRKWKSIGLQPESAFDSQGLIELYNNLCIQKKCLNCNIGANLLKHD